MKQIITLFFVIYLHISVLSQSMDPIQDLYSIDDKIVWSALEEIEANQIVEAIPVIIELIRGKHPVTQLRFLEVLKFFQYDDLIGLVYDFIGRSDSFNEFDPPFDPLRAKISATLLLFYLGDFSTFDYVFEYINRNKPSVAVEAVYLLPFIQKYVPAYSNDAYNELLYAYLNSAEGSNIKYFCLENLNKLNPSNFNSDLINQFTQSEVFENRIQALRLLCHNKIAGLNQILIYQLSHEGESSIRINIVDSLLVLYGLPSDLKAIIDHLPNEVNSTAYSIISYEIEEFIPPRPTVTTDEMIENLITYNRELFEYGWINIESLRTDFEASLERIQNEYRNSDLTQLCEIIYNLFIQIDDAVAADNLTNEGYKFMHYHVMYIKESIETELGTCEEREK